MEKQISCIIVDDEHSAIAVLKGLLRTIPGVSLLAEITDPALAVETIGKHAPDLVFLDIQMPGKSGFEIAHELHEAGDPPDIIFVTAFDRFAIEAIRHAAFDFLVKPVIPEELAQAIARLKQKPEKSDQAAQFRKLIGLVMNRPKIKISNAGGFSLIDPAEIVFIRADWNYSELFFNHEKSELATMNIGLLEETLPEKEFYRISRSLIINVNYLKKVSRKKRQALLVKDGVEYAFPIPLLNIRKLERFLEG